MEHIEIIQATVNDAEEILNLQRLAYQSEARRYDDYHIPPLTQTIEEMRKQFETHIFLKAIFGGKIVGTVRAHEETGTCHIGRLAVRPDRQNLGIGTTLMKTIEGYYSSERFELFVGSKSEKNIHLYEKLGYSIFKADSHECGHIEVFYMEKDAKIVRGDKTISSIEISL